MILNWPIIITCAVGISILLTLFIIPQIIRVSIAKGLFDRPNERKIHKGTIPRLGGVAFLPVILLTVGIIMVIPATLSFSCPPGYNDGFVSYLPEILVLVAAMIIMFLTGVLDDLMGLKYGMKFIAQIIAAVLIVEAGAYITEYYGLFGIHHTGVAIGKIITAFLVVYIVNSYNLIDGIDGLAAGIGVITLSYYGMVLFASGLFFFSVISWIGAASVAVFWCFNVFGSAEKQTKIFMGDVGSLSIGIFIAFLGVIIVHHPVVPLGVESGTSKDPLILALSPMMLPLFDVIRVFCIRILKGKSPFLPDKRHIHHRMMESGFSMKTTMVTLLIIQVIILVFNLQISEFVNINWILCADLALYMGCIMLLRPFKERQLKKMEK